MCVFSNTPVSGGLSFRFSLLYIGAFICQPSVTFFPVVLRLDVFLLQPLMMRFVAAKDIVRCVRCLMRLGSGAR